MRGCQPLPGRVDTFAPFAPCFDTPTRPCAIASAWNPLGTGLCANETYGCDPARYNRSSDQKQWERFVLRHRAQVLEVLTKYGEILELSFDMNFPPSFDEDSAPPPCHRSHAHLEPPRTSLHLYGAVTGRACARSHRSAADDHARAQPRT